MPSTLAGAAQSDDELGRPSVSIRGSCTSLEMSLNFSALASCRHSSTQAAQCREAPHMLMDAMAAHGGIACSLQLRTATGLHVMRTPVLCLDSIVDNRDVPACL